jgi:hypothetical protein
MDAVVDTLCRAFTRILIPPPWSAVRSSSGNCSREPAEIVRYSTGAPAHATSPCTRTRSPSSEKRTVSLAKHLSPALAVHATSTRIRELSAFLPFESTRTSAASGSPSTGTRQVSVALSGSGRSPALQQPRKGSHGPTVVGSGRSAAESAESAEIREKATAGSSIG